MRSNYRRLIYKRRYSVPGILLFLLIFSVETTYKTLKYIILNLIKFIKWYRNYIQFAKAGYSYTQVQNMIMQMSGRQFEIFMSEIFKALGYRRVVLTQESCDGGKDIILYGNNGVTYVETKRWKEGLDVGRERLQKLVGSAIGDKVDNMIFITTSGFNNNAYEYAAKVDNLVLWDMDDLMKQIVKIDQRQLPRILAKTIAYNNKVVNLNPV